jgi:hypothetical protein
MQTRIIAAAAALSTLLLTGWSIQASTQTITAPSIFNQLCGSYSLNFAGVLPPHPVLYIAGSGQLKSDCDGNLSGVETTNVEGTVCVGTLVGTYKLNNNGTGTDKLTLTPPVVTKSCPKVTFTESIAVGAGGTVVKAINSGPNQVTTYEEWVKQ